MAGSIIPFPGTRALPDSDMARSQLAERMAGTPAWLNRAERWRTNNRWGDLGATQLSAILEQGARGYVDDWADLVEYAVGSDDHMISLYTTRTNRVVQADWIISPNKRSLNDPKSAALAEQAALFIDARIGQIENWDDALQELLHAIALGYSHQEMKWAFEKSSKTHFVEYLEFIHPHRFRYDEQWRLRLFDRGIRRGPEGYGEVLDQRWGITHFHKEQAGYPGIGGVMRSCIWRWMFRRWVDKFWIHNVETYGSPFAYAKVVPDTPQSVRDKILASLQNLSDDHVGVIEAGGEIVIEAAKAAAGNRDIHQTYMQFAEASLTKAWLGMSDAVDPGAHGSQAAVTTRTSSTMDPRMVMDGKRLATTLRRTLFKRLIWENRHLFPDAASVNDIPIPEMRFKTADDEVVQDKGAKASEQGAERGSASDATPTGEKGNDPSTQPIGSPIRDGRPRQPPPRMADLAAELEMIIKHEDGKWVIYSEDGSKKLGTYDTKAEAVDRLRQIEGHKHDNVDDDPTPQMVADPKVHPRSEPGRSSRTRQTTRVLASPLERALRGELAGSAFSRPKPRSKQPKSSDHSDPSSRQLSLKPIP